MFSLFLQDHFCLVFLSRVRNPSFQVCFPFWYPWFIGNSCNNDYSYFISFRNIFLLYRRLLTNFLYIPGILYKHPNYERLYIHYACQERRKPNFILLYAARDIILLEVSSCSYYRWTVKSMSSMFKTIHNK